MKQNNKIITFSMLLAAMASNANAQNDYPDSVANKVNVAFKAVDKEDLLGGVASVNMVDLTDKSYSAYATSNLGSIVATDGWSSGGMLVLVDGVPRDLNNVLPSEIEQVTYLKGASATVLYGSRAAHGAILVTTKRGRTDGLHVSVRGNFSTYTPKEYPSWLGSAEYMTLYNEALLNDGKDPVYSQDLIANYAKGDDPYRYPNLNFYDKKYIKNHKERYEGVAEFTGGGKYANFYANIGLYHVGDLMNFGEGKDNHVNRLNVRGNIDLRLNSWVSGWVNANATFYDTRSDLSGYWGSSASIRPTSQYPLVPFIPIDRVDASDIESWKLIDNSNYLVDGKYLLGGTQNQQTNPFAAMYAAGYNKFTSRQLQFDAGIKLDLNSVLKGLSFKTQFAVDYSTTYNTSINNSYSVYEASWNNYNGAGAITSLKKYGTDKKSGTQNLSGSTSRQTIMFSGQFDWARNFGDHNVGATLLAHGYQIQNTGSYHRTSNANLGFQTTYNYQHKYYVDFSGAAIHSAKLAPGHREAFSPTVSAAWRLSKENFLKDVKWLDDLKLNASYGLIHEDVDISDYYMYDDVFTATGTWWGWSESANSMQTSDSKRAANYDLTFIKRKEFRVGLDASLFGGDIKLNANYFINNLNGFIVASDVNFPNYFHTYWPVSQFIPNMNYNNSRYTGIDYTVDLHKKVGEVDLKLGLTGYHITSKNTRVAENVEYDWLKYEGQRTDALRGYKCLGFFQNEDEIKNSAVVNSNTKPGDLKYQDMNGDGVIDSKDEVVLGHWGADFNYGLNFTAKWKGFTLFAAGSGSVGGMGIKNNLMTWNYGDRKYSDVVRGRWTKETAATATYPRLTAENDGSLNFVTSDFWTYSTSAFRLDKVQLTYNLPQSLFQGKWTNWIKGVAVYVYGTDLLTIAKECKYMETAVGAEPQYRTYNLGFKVNL